MIRNFQAQSTESEVARYQLEEEMNKKQEAIALMEANEREKLEEIERFKKEVIFKIY